MVAIRQLPLLLLMVGSASLLRAEATDPRHATPLSPQPVYQERVQRRSAEDPKSESGALKEMPGGQELEKADLDRSFDSQTIIQSVDAKGADLGKVVALPPQEGKNEPPLDLQSLASFDSGLTPLPNGGGWKLVAGPHLTIKDCQQELGQKIVAVTNQYIAEKFGREDIGRLLQSHRT